MTKLPVDLTDIIMELNQEQIKEAWEIMRLRMSDLNSSKRLAFRRGDKVRFDARTKGIQTGVVTKINSKTIAVKAITGVTWKVPPGLLTKIAA